jgi:hypothetical protein
MPWPAGSSNSKSSRAGGETSVIRRPDCVDVSAHLAFPRLGTSSRCASTRVPPPYSGVHLSGTTLDLDRTG